MKSQLYARHLISIPKRLGLSILTVLAPTKIAWFLERKKLPNFREFLEVIHLLWKFLVAILPSSEVAIFIVMKGLFCNFVLKNARLISCASFSPSPTSTFIPDFCKISTPLPRTLASGSIVQITTLENLFLMISSTQGEVLPKWLHGSKLT